MVGGGRLLDRGILKKVEDDDEMEVNMGELG